MRALLLLLALTACVEPDLVPCGDSSCPTGSVCLAAADRCVTPSQLASCAQLDPGAGCITGDVSGRCLDGACTPMSCGNGVLEAGEVCDDGNRISGDGCSGTCNSDESCGNGVVDVSAGEGCDCGDAEHASAICARINSDQADAPCDMQCRPRFCGDGVVDLVEQCDGSVPATRSCEQFGYYDGALTCTDFCQLDPQPSCVGRCGDGIIQAEHGEYCDGSVDASSSCLQFGKDFGGLTCGLACGPDLSECGRLGWELIHLDTAAARSGWGGAGRIAWVASTGVAWAATSVRATPVATSTGDYQVITGSPTTTWAFGARDVASWTAASGWTTSAAPWASDSIVFAAWASDTLGEFVSLTGQAALWHYDGTAWTTVTGAWDAGPALGRTTSKLFVLSDARADVFDGSWSQFTAVASPVQEIAEDGKHRLWVQNDSGTLRSEGAAWVHVDNRWAVGMTGTRDGVYGIVTPLESDGSVTRFGDRPARWPFPGDAFGQVVSDGNDIPVMFSNKGIFAVANGMWLPPVPGLYYPPTRLAGGPRVLGFQYQAENGNWLSLFIDPNNFDVCRYMAMSAAGASYCGGDNSLWEDSLEIAIPKVRGMWATADGATLFAAGDQSFGIRDKNGWDIAAAPDTMSLVAGDAIDDLYVQGNGGVWHYTGTWQLVTSGRSMSVTPSAIYTLDGTGAVSAYDRATHASTSLAGVPPLLYLVPGRGDELFGLAATSDDDSRLWLYADRQWSRVRLPAELRSPWRLGGVDGDIYVTNVTGQFEPPYPLYRTSAW